MGIGGFLRRIIGQGPKTWRGRRARGSAKSTFILRGVFQAPAEGGPPPPHFFRLPPWFDEHGFPVAWKTDPLEDPFSYRLLVKSKKRWPIFEEWCADRSIKSLPASMETVIGFLANPPVEGRELYDTWRAISRRHRAHYRKEVVDPCFMLRLEGVEVYPDGTVIIPDEIRREFGL